jgi:ubiquitin-protein ligase
MTVDPLQSVSSSKNISKSLFGNEKFVDNSVEMQKHSDNMKTPMIKMLINLRPVLGPFCNESLLFALYFPSNYPYSPPLIYLIINDKNDNANKLTHKALYFNIVKNENTLEVNNPIFNEEWNPVLTLTQIILSLEIMTTFPDESSILKSKNKI